MWLICLPRWACYFTHAYIRQTQAIHVCAACTCTHLLRLCWSTILLPRQPDTRQQNVADLLAKVRPYLLSCLLSTLGGLLCSLLHIFGPCLHCLACARSQVASGYSSTKSHNACALLSAEDALLTAKHALLSAEHASLAAEHASSAPCAFLSAELAWWAALCLLSAEHAL